MKNGEKKGFVIPDGGWVCLMCQNYNFYGRVKCNRCGKIKTKEDPIGRPKYFLKKILDENDPPAALKEKKQLREQQGDWTCLSCNNINYSFRKQCNRCKANKEYGRRKLNKEALPWKPLSLSQI